MKTLLVCCNSNSDILTGKNLVKTVHLTNFFTSQNDLDKPIYSYTGGRSVACLAPWHAYVGGRAEEDHP